MKIAIDLDGVIRDTYRYICDMRKKGSSWSVKPYDKWEIELEKNFLGLKDNPTEYMFWAEAEKYAENLVSKELLKKVKGKSNTLSLLTAARRRKIAMEWIVDNSVTFAFDDVVFTRFKSRWDADVYIDDDPRQLTWIETDSRRYGLPSKKLILIDQPFNRNEEDILWTRCSDINSALQYLLNEQ